MPEAPVIHIVGVCGSGKSTLARHLTARGYRARQISQEHSGAPELWRWKRVPDALIYLDASGEAVRRRYPGLNMTDEYLAMERERLAHARAHADCLILTDGLTPEQVLARAMACLEEMGLDI
ncbi:MAG TPA: hypothetical protein EYP25_07210 [Anaerolineae bacterium]|nr:hypothetical protein [Caldilineae bacterium]HID34343.1 hypothetical protein [Anaerolineae bacterium]